MSGSLGEQEVVGFGNDRVRSATGAARGLRHPRLIALVVVVLLAGVGAVVVHQRSAVPPLPTLASVRLLDPSGSAADGEPTTYWDAGLDARPAGRAHVEVNAVLRFAGAPPTGIDVDGITGPGVPPPTGPRRHLAAGATDSAVDLASVVDCAAAPLPAAAAAYRLRVEVRDGSRRRQGSLDSTELGAAWARQLDRACGSWLARRDLTVTAAAASVDPVLARTAIALTVTNAGASAATADLTDLQNSLAVTASPTGPLRIPAGGSARVRLDVTLRTCDQATDDPQTGLPPPVSTTAGLLGLVATVGDVAQPTAPDAAPDGTAPTGIVFASTAQATVTHALAQACGGVEGFAALIDAGGARYDPRTRLLTLRVLVDGTPGRVRDVQLVSQARTDPATPAPLWGRTPRLVPDRTGQAVATLTYRSPTTSICPGEHAYLPGFGIIARVPSPGGVRTLRFTQYVDPWQDAAVLAELCPAG